jgi:hypothetical protein
VTFTHHSCSWFLLSFVVKSEDNQVWVQRNDKVFSPPKRKSEKFFHYAACRRLFELECCFIFFISKKSKKAESKKDNLHNDIVCIFSRLSENCYSLLCSWDLLCIIELCPKHTKDTRLNLSFWYGKIFSLSWAFLIRGCLCYVETTFHHHLLAFFHDLTRPKEDRIELTLSLCLCKDWDVQPCGFIFWFLIHHWLYMNVLSIIDWLTLCCPVMLLKKNVHLNVITLKLSLRFSLVSPIPILKREINCKIS